jgi:hypothetical protein
MCLVGEYGICLVFGEYLEQPLRNDDAGIAAQTAVGEGVRCGAVDDAESGHREATLPAKSFDELALGRWDLC